MAQEDNDKEDPYLTDEQLKQLEYERNEIIANNILSNNNPETRNGKTRKKPNPKKQAQNQTHAHYVQKYSEPGLLAEAVIVGGITYFAVSRSNSNESYL